ncbi:MAG: peptidase S8, partial [Ignavibacteriaceae bacterium]|nr:peptidase S8 [Ignavibacteriaceae bacterium]
EEKQPGTYEVSFNAAEFGSGVYIYSLRAGSFVQSRKMILIR